MNLQKELLLPSLRKLDFHAGLSERHGTYYEVPAHKGKGYYWYYAKKDQFYISIADTTFLEDEFMAFDNFACMGVVCYFSISGEMLNPYRRISCNNIIGYAASREKYEAIYHKDIPVRSVGINIFPAYYKEILNAQYPGEFENPGAAFSAINGTTSFPEMMLLLKQLEAYRGSGTAADLYYESKVAEAVSLIVDRAKEYSLHKKALTYKNVSEHDMEKLRVVAAYIDDHYAKNIRLEQLAHIACMGATKFKYAFRDAYHCTVTEYMQSKRIGHAEQMLMNTDLEIKEIAQIIGYTHAGRFSELFKRHIGLTPVEYRKLLNIKK